MAGDAVALRGRGPLELHDEDDGEYWEDDEEDESRFINFSLLSHIAVQLRDKVPRGTHVKGSIPYPHAFTGKDIVVCTNVHIFYVTPSTEQTICLVNNPITDTARATNQSWRVDKRPAGSPSSCS